MTAQGGRFFRAFVAEARYYFRLGLFRAREHWSDLNATFLVYLLYGFFIWVLSYIWIRFHRYLDSLSPSQSLFDYRDVVLYIGVTELLFMSFLSTKQILGSTEDFVLFLARPRSWIGREVVSNVGGNLSKRLLFAASLFIVSFLLGTRPEPFFAFWLRLLEVLFLLALPQALLSTLFSTFRLQFPMTDYFILPFGKLFLALGGVFGPLSDYGEPWRSLFLKLPGSDLFFQPAYYVVKGELYQVSYSHWIFRLIGIHLVLYVLVLIFYRMGRKRYQAWGG